MVPMNLFAGQQWRHRHENRLRDMGWREGECGTDGESGLGTYSIMYEIDSQ